MKNIDQYTVTLDDIGKLMTAAQNGYRAHLLYKTISLFYKENPGRYREHKAWYYSIAVAAAETSLNNLAKLYIADDQAIIVRDICTKYSEYSETKAFKAKSKDWLPVIKSLHTIRDKFISHIDTDNHKFTDLGIDVDTVGVMFKECHSYLNNIRYVIFQASKAPLLCHTAELIIDMEDVLGIDMRNK